MGFKCGIVGLPNVGKSTLFNALTVSGIAAENYPFCTIEPNVGIVAVPDPRLDQLAAIVSPQRVIPAVMEFVDIAGLVAGAAAGEGLGNRFLANIRETDAIAHVVRCFEDDDITHVGGAVNPLADIETIDTELALADLETAERALERAAKLAKAGDKAMLARQRLCEQLVAHLGAGHPARSLGLPAEATEILSELHLLTAKPVLYIANVAEQGYGDNPLLNPVREHAAASGAELVAVSAAIEAEIASLPPGEKQEFLDDLGLDEPGLDRVIRAGYRLLGLETFFTAGPKEVRAWTIRAGATAPEAAGRIHTDFQRGFIKAEVIAFADYVALGGESGAKDAGRLRQEGKEYPVRDGDVIHFKFNL